MTEPIKPSPDDPAREEFCRLLAASYYQPDEMFREERVFPRLAERAAAIDADLAQTAAAVAEAFAGENPDELLLDYSRLFLGPFDILAKPYGSVWLEGDKVLMGDSTMAVKELYRAGGFELADDFNEVPDHIAVELEFLYLLIYQDHVDLRQRFLQDHLGRWIEPFTAAMEQGARTDFYRLLAELTRKFVGREQRLLQGPKPQTAR